MRAVLQRVSGARVEVDGKEVGAIGAGLLIFLGVAQGDSREDAEYLADKLTNLRIFPDETGKMNRSLRAVSGQALIVSQFTLLADCRKGRRPSFEQAAPPAEARVLYNYLVERLHEMGLFVSTGIFQAEMKISLTNEGPVTIILESRKN